MAASSATGDGSQQVRDGGPEVCRRPSCPTLVMLILVAFRRASSVSGSMSTCTAPSINDFRFKSRCSRPRTRLGCLHSQMPDGQPSTRRGRTDGQRFLVGLVPSHRHTGPLHQHPNSVFLYALQSCFLHHEMREVHQLPCGESHKLPMPRVRPSVRGCPGCEFDLNSKPPNYRLFKEGVVHVRQVVL